MIEIYSSWVKGLDTDREALKLIKDSGILSGVEVWGPELAENIRKQGLKSSLHNPIKALKLDLVDEKLIEELKKEENSRIMRGISDSSSEVVGFHLYFKADAVMHYL